MSLRESDVFAPPPERKQRKRRTRKCDSESAVLRECMLWLKQYGALVVRTNTGTVRLDSGRWMKSGSPGWPDITGLLPDGRFIGVECKARSGGRQSPQQKRIEQEIRKRKGVYILARSAGDVAKALDGRRE
jgi:hypothetical protein